MVYTVNISYISVDKFFKNTEFTKFLNTGHFRPNLNFLHFFNQKSHENEFSIYCRNGIGFNSNFLFSGRYHLTILKLLFPLLGKLFLIHRAQVLFKSFLPIKIRRLNCNKSSTKSCFFGVGC